MSKHLANNLQEKQKDWNLATQKRLAMTTSMLGSMKSLKMLGITPYTESMVHSLRLEELDMAKKVRWMMVAYNASGKSLSLEILILSNRRCSECSRNIFPHSHLCIVRSPCTLEWLLP